MSCFEGYWWAKESLVDCLDGLVCTWFCQIRRMTVELLVGGGVVKGLVEEGGNSRGWRRR